MSRAAQGIEGGHVAAVDLGPLAQVVGDVVPGEAEVFEEPDLAEAGVVLLQGEEQVVRGVAAVAGDAALVRAAEGEPDLGDHVDAAVDVVSAQVAPVGEVGFVVVLEAVDPQVVVHVDAEEELGPVRGEAQEGFLVVGHQVRQVAGGVLVEVGDEIDVLVVPREDLEVGVVEDALPVRKRSWSSLSSTSS